MNESAASHIWAMRIWFVVLVTSILFFHLLPLQTATGGLIWPDFLLLFALAWSVRRPDFVPPVLLAILFLVADLLLQRPPGLWALLALIACEKMKTQSRTLRDASLATELVSVTLWIVGISVAYRLILAILLIDVPSLGPALIQIVVTAVAYPMVVAITHTLMRVRKATPGDIDGKGVRS